MIWLDVVALICFFTFWFGYSRFARIKAKNTDCLARSLHQHRIHWMQEYVKKELRMTDAGLIGSLERNIAFFASSALLILAGVITLFAQVEYIEQVISSIPYAAKASPFLIQVKLLTLAVVFIGAFFHFTWAIRQFGFVNVMMGATPYEEGELDEDLKLYAKQMAIVQDQASHSYNYGLRAFYFSLAAASWFIHPILLIATTILVIYTLYLREFKSKSVNAITDSQKILRRRP